MILLTHGYFLNQDQKEQEIMKPYVPLGILYLSAFLQQKGIQHEVIDTTFSTPEIFQDQLLKMRPSLVGIYTNLMTKISVLKIVRFIKKSPELKECKIVLGGPEIRHNARNYLQEGVDMLVVGEGEQTFFEISDSVLKTGELPEDTAGTCYLKNQELYFAPERTLIKNMDELPMPARNRIDLHLYGQAWKDHHGYSMFSLSTMRGCPYTCKWCSRAVYGGTYRRRSPKLVADEMQILFDHYKPDRIWFVDDVFTISHKWLREFRDEVMDRKLKMPYEIITRADRMNDEVISMLKETGCFRVWIGAESGSQRIIEAMDRRVDVKMVRDMIIKTKQAGIEAGTFIMLGYPGEKREDIKETIKHLQESNPSSYTITVAYPITGTPLYEEVNKTLQAKDDWSKITDRDYDFKRENSRRYYRYAVNWVYNEVNFAKAGNLFGKFKFKSKSYVAQALMLFS